MASQSDFSLTLRDSDADASRLQRLTRDLSMTLDRQQDLRAHVQVQKGQAGAKGDPITLGAIALTIGAAGVKSLIGVLKAYVERKPSLSVEITRQNGDKISVSGQSLPAKQWERVEQFLRG